jgi:hypothetical protein
MLSGSRNLGFRKKTAEHGVCLSTIMHFHIGTVTIPHVSVHLPEPPHDQKQCQAIVSRWLAWRRHTRAAPNCIRSLDAFLAWA